MQVFLAPLFVCRVGHEIETGAMAHYRPAGFTHGFSGMAETGPSFPFWCDRLASAAATEYGKDDPLGL
jgi:hypothetical protein